MTADSKHDPQAIIQGVLSDFLRLDAPQTTPFGRGSRRGVLVLDETTAFLEAALTEANFWVVSPPREMSLSDFETRAQLLTGRILVTRTTTPYLDHAPVLDYGVIGLDALSTLATTETYVGNATVKLISRAVTRFRLASKGPAWVIMMVEDGEHVFERLE